MTDILTNGIIGVVVGDALSLSIQFASKTARDAGTVTGMRGLCVFDMPAGSWSDDSRLTLAALDTLNRYGYDLDKIM